jgi:hypothetical protein
MRTLIAYLIVLPAVLAAIVYSRYFSGWSVMTGYYLYCLFSMLACGGYFLHHMIRSHHGLGRFGTHPADDQG